MSRPMKDSGVEWIGKIPAHWEERRIYTLCSKIFLGRTPVYSEIENINLIIGQKNNQLYGIDMNDVKYGTDDFYNSRPDEEFVRNGDILLNSLGTGSVGRVGFYNLEQKVLTDGHIIVFRLKKGEYSKYIYYFLSSIHKQLEDMAIGSTNQAFLTVSKIYKLYVPYPSISDQQKIAAHLDRKCTQIDALIANAEQQIEKLKAYKQSVITETVTKGLDPDVKMKDSGVEWIGEIPEHCSLVPMKYLAEAIGDGIHSTPNYDINGDIFFINGNNIGEERIQFKESTNRINAEELAKYKAPHLTDNTIMISLNGTYGKASFYNGEPVLLGKSAGYITLKPSINKKYIRYYLQSGIAKLIMDLSLAGTTIPNLSLRTLNAFLVIYPELQEQDKMVAYLDRKCSQIDKLIALKQQKIEKLQQYKKSLIYEYVTGKKEV